MDLLELIAPRRRVDEVNAPARADGAVGGGADADARHARLRVAHGHHRAHAGSVRRRRGPCDSPINRGSAATTARSLPSGGRTEPTRMLFAPLLICSRPPASSPRDGHHEDDRRHAEDMPAPSQAPRLCSRGFQAGGGFEEKDPVGSVPVGKCYCKWIICLHARPLTGNWKLKLGTILWLKHLLRSSPGDFRQDCVRRTSGHRI